VRDAGLSTRLYSRGLADDRLRRAQTLHGLEQDPTEDHRMERFDEQVVWADRNSLLHRVQMFLDAMPSSGWAMRKD
jgi:hypothetical protein